MNKTILALTVFAVSAQSYAGISIVGAGTKTFGQQKLVLQGQKPFVNQHQPKGFVTPSFEKGNTRVTAITEDAKSGLGKVKEIEVRNMDSQQTKVDIATFRPHSPEYKAGQSSKDILRTDIGYDPTTGTLSVSQQLKGTVRPDDGTRPLKFHDPRDAGPARVQSVAVPTEKVRPDTHQATYQTVEANAAQTGSSSMQVQTSLIVNEHARNTTVQRELISGTDFRGQFTGYKIGSGDTRGRHEGYVEARSLVPVQGPTVSPVEVKVFKIKTEHQEAAGKAKNNLNDKTKVTFFSTVETPAGTKYYQTDVVMGVASPSQAKSRPDVYESELGYVMVKDEKPGAKQYFTEGKLKVQSITPVEITREAALQAGLVLGVRASDMRATAVVPAGGMGLVSRQKTEQAK